MPFKHFLANGRFLCTINSLGINWQTTTDLATQRKQTASVLPTARCRDRAKINRNFLKSHTKVNCQINTLNKTFTTLKYRYHVIIYFIIIISTGLYTLRKLDAKYQSMSQSERKPPEQPTWPHLSECRRCTNPSH